MPDDLHEYLRTLPDAKAPGGLWPRLLERRRQQRRRRRTALAAASGTLALVLAVALWTPTVQEPARAVADDIELREQLHALDRALQAAYDRGASDAEVEPMWEARDALLAGNDVASRAHEI